MILHCSDGLYGYVLDEEILDAVKYHPGEACKRLIALAEKRQASDNVSVQIIQVWEVEQAAQRARPLPNARRPVAGDEIGVGTLLDDRFEITDVIAKSGMASLFKANDRQTGKAVALKMPYLQIESDPAGFDRFQREEEIGLRLDHPYILKMYSRRKEEPAVHRDGISGGPDLERTAEQCAAAAGAGRRRKSPPASARRWPTCTRTAWSTAT